MGSRYHVWDQEANIRFVAPGNALVKGVYQVDDQTLEEIKAKAATGEKVLHTFETDITPKAATGEKVLHTFETDITHADGSVVAHVNKVLYIRLKKQYRPNPN